MSQDMLEKVFSKLVEIETNNKKQFNALHEKVDTQFSRMTKKVDGIAEQVRINSEDITVLKSEQTKLNESNEKILSSLNNLATKDDLEYFDKKITEHDREIFKIKQKA